MKSKKEYSNIVLMSFIRIMKNKDNYEVIQDRFKKIYKDKDNPLGNISSFDDLSSKLYSLSTEHFKENRRSGDDYEFITMLVNNLLHFIYEPICANKSSLGLIGQEIFDLACYRIFGEKYLQDMEKLNNGIKRPETEEEAILISEYMGLLNSGKKISWEKFLDMKRKMQASIDDEILKYLKFSVN